MNQEQGFARGQWGLTLLEMMITIALAGIMLGAVVPSAMSIIDKSRITAQVNRMSSVLQFTSYQAIDQNMPVALCPTPDLTSCDITNWNLPKMVFNDRNFNKKRDQNETLIHMTSKLPTGVSMQGPRKLVRFYEDGTLGSTATLLICPQQPNDKLNRALFISLQGRVRLSRDSNKDSVHERGNGQALVCP